KALINSKNLMKNQIESLNAVSKNSGLKYHQEFLTQVQQDIETFKEQTVNKIQEYINENQQNRSIFYDGNKLKDSDPVLDEIKEIYDGKFSESIQHDELISLYQQGEVRFSFKIPPGFEDVVKGDFRSFGDYIVWEEMIKLSQTRSVPVIFVTEDHKNDWWVHDEKTHTKSPLPDLLREFKMRTGQYTYFYSYKDFIEQAKSRYSDLPETDRATMQMDLATQENEDNELENIPQIERIGALRDGFSDRRFATAILLPSLYKQALAKLKQLKVHSSVSAYAHRVTLESIMDSDTDFRGKILELKNMINNIENAIESYEN
ncbi:PIN-like domain-containing protein, partial [Mesobacillus campisalis]